MRLSGTGQLSAQNSQEQRTWKYFSNSYWMLSGRSLFRLDSASKLFNVQRLSQSSFINHQAASMLVFFKKKHILGNLASSVIQ
jgi:hypothetical protein